MSEPARLPRLLAALSLMIPLLGAAQTPAMTDLERAQRDAEKVLSFIKFQTVKTRPAAEPAEKPRKPPVPIPQRPANTARPAEAASVAPAAEPAPPEPARTAQVASPQPAMDPTPAPVAEQPAATFGAPAATPAPAVATPAPEAEPEADDRDEVALQLRNFVAPVLPRSAQATLVGGSRKVTVRFTVETDGTVSKAAAAADVPLRLARPATDAILQWQFAPLPQPRTVDVEIAFRRE